MKKIALSIILLAVILTGCGVDAASVSGADNARSPYYGLAPWENVKLTWATMRYTERTERFDICFSGQIMVRNLAYEKIVAIRYTTDGWKTWKVCFAKYGFADSSKETWKFTTPSWSFSKANVRESLTSAVSINFDFAVYYTVNNATYWDNNNGENFHLDQNTRYVSN